MFLKSVFTSFTFATLLSASLATAQANSTSSARPPIDAYSSSIYDELVRVRRDLFNHPEASGQERRTAGVVANYLKKLGLEVKTNIGGYGVVGILKGKRAGKHIAWRADMDAAEFEFGNHKHGDGDEDEGKAKVAHVCGHDVHTTIALGIANTLSQYRENLAGTVYFLFQPAEETQQGAKAMIKDGLFELIKPDEIYALHVAPMETGVITTSPGNVYSHARNVEIRFSGNNDAEALYNTVNQIMASQIRLTSPEKFTQLLNVSDPKLGLGSPDTIYQNYVLFNGSPRMDRSEKGITFRAELFASQAQDIERTKQNIEQQVRASLFAKRLVSVQFAHDRQGVDNDPSLVKDTTDLLRKAYGKQAVQNNYGHVPFASEDFGHFQKTVPGVYFFMGVANPDTGNIAFPHLPNFEVDEASIEFGVSRFSTLIWDRLKDEKKSNSKNADNT